MKWRIQYFDLNKKSQNYYSDSVSEAVKWALLTMQGAGGGVAFLLEKVSENKYEVVEEVKAW